MPNVLAYTMSLDNKGFTAPLRHAESLVSGSIGKIGAAFAGLGVALGAFKGIEGVFAGIAGVAAKGFDLKKLSATTGQSIRDLAILQKAFEETGIGSESVGQSLFMLQKSLGGVNEQGEPTKQIFDQLGLSIESLKGRPAIEQLQSIAGAIGKLGDQESKTAAISGIFGRSGREMLALLGDSSAINEAVDAYGPMADVLQKNAVAFAKLELAILKFKARIANIFVGITEKIGPQLTALLDRLRNAFDGLKIGRKLGDAIKVALEAGDLTKLGDLFGEGLAFGVEKAVPRIYNALLQAFHGPIAYMQAKLVEIFQKLHPSMGGNIFQNLNIKTWEWQLKHSAADMEKYSPANRSKLTGIESLLPEKDLEALYGAAVKNYEEANKALQKIEAAAKSMGQPLSSAELFKHFLGEQPPGAESVYSGAPESKGGGKKFPSDLMGAKLSEGDRLAKIGVFIGGGANRMLDFMQQIARNTAATAANTKPEGGNNNETPAATYA